MSKQTQKMWQRAFIREEVDVALKHLEKASQRAEASYLPARLRIRLARLMYQVEMLREAIRSWPITDGERAQRKKVKA